jgi:hypothetical protein
MHPFRFCGEETPYLMARSLLELGSRAGRKPAALMPADDNAADLFPRGIDLILTPGNFLRIRQLTPYVELKTKTVAQASLSAQSILGD